MVDDSYEVRDGLKSILTGRGGIDLVDEASSGAEAMDKLEKVRFDGVLVDVQTDERGWIDLVRQIKRKWPGTKVILLLVHSVGSQDVTASGADGCLFKDSPREEIIHVVSLVLGSAG